MVFSSNILVSWHRLVSPTKMLAFNSSPTLTFIVVIIIMSVLVVKLLLLGLSDN